MNISIVTLHNNYDIFDLESVDSLGNETNTTVDTW